MIDGFGVRVPETRALGGLRRVGPCPSRSATSCGNQLVRVGHGRLSRLIGWESGVHFHVQLEGFGRVKGRVQGAPSTFASQGRLRRQTCL